MTIVQFLITLTASLLVGFVFGVALMAVAAASKAAQHLYDFPATETHELRVHAPEEGTAL